MFKQDSHNARRFFARHRSGIRKAVGIVGLTLALVAGVLSLGSPMTPVVRASSKRERAAGAVLFHERGCEHCHGVDGVGTERGPDLSTVGKRLKKPEIADQIREGGDEMPAFGNVLPPDEITALVAYLKAKRKAPKHSKKLAPIPPAAVQPAGTDPGL